MGVYGVSAGGGLAAALALLLRDRGEMPLAFQLLEAPMLDDRQQTPSSNLDGLAVFSKQSNEFCWRAYLGEALRRSRCAVLRGSGQSDQPLRTPTLVHLRWCCGRVQGRVH